MAAGCPLAGPRKGLEFGPVLGICWRPISREATVPRETNVVESGPDSAGVGGGVGVTAGFQGGDDALRDWTPSEE